MNLYSWIADLIRLFTGAENYTPQKREIIGFTIVLLAILFGLAILKIGIL
jgi:uncharacterized membrane protein YidH (DUF202 family)